MRLLSLLVAVVTLAGASTSGAQASRADPRPAGQPSGDSSRVATLRIARDIMRAARYAALVTIDPATGPAARTVDPSPPDTAMTVVFATNPKSRKVRQIARDARVVLHYLDAQGQRYVSLHGTARMVRDSAEQRRRWNATWNPFYPGREREASLYVVHPSRLEVVSPGEGLVGDSATWQPVTLHFPSRRPIR